MPGTRSNRGRGARRSARAAADARPAAERAPGPLDSQFAAALAAIAPPAPFALAVSGGPDSVALMLLAAAWARGKCAPPVVFTVDHGLRPGAAEEARQVGAWAAALGLAHEVLHWTGPRPASGLQAAARAARYALLAAAARRRGLPALLLGHTADDQAETHLMRLARGGGIDALAGMAARAMRPALAPGVLLVRPLLAVTRPQILDFLAAAGHPSLKDPSNADPRFERVRVRRLIAAMGAGGVTVPMLAEAAATLAAARDALDGAARAWGALAIAGDGAVALAVPAFARAPEVLRARMLRLALKAAAGEAAAPDAAEAARLAAALCAPGFRGATLSGARALAPAGGRVLIVRELAAVAPPQALWPDRGLWDGRFLTCGAGPEHADLRLGALGPEGLRAARALARADTRRLPGPAARLHALPALFAGGKLAAVPHLALRAPEAPAGLDALALRLAAEAHAPATCASLAFHPTPTYLFARSVERF